MLQCVSFFFLVLCLFVFSGMGKIVVKQCQIAFYSISNDEGDGSIKTSFPDFLVASAGSRSNDCFFFFSVSCSFSAVSLVFQGRENVL